MRSGGISISFGDRTFRVIIRCNKDAASKPTSTSLRETLVSGTARKSDLPGHLAAGKTGTTQDYRDAWFVGYTGQLVTAVWVGNDDGEAMKKVSGSGLPAELWADFMKQAHAGLKPQPLPGLNGDIPMGDMPPPVANAQPNSDNPSAWQGPSSHERSLLDRLLGR